MNPSRLLKPKFYAEFQPAVSWIAILGFIGLSGLCTIVGLSKYLNLLFPTGAFAVGLLLYYRSPLLYLGFTWWLWFLSPLIRRYVDFRSSFTDPSPILLTPYLVTLITLITFFQHLPKSKRQGGFPFVLSFIGVFYGYLIGAISGSPVSATTKGIEWFAPIVFGLHLFTNWRSYPSYRKSTQRIFLWCVLIAGAYGIFQFLVAPDWDQAWLLNLDERSITFGRPKPFEIRVWSTMQGPLVFADVMMAGLLLLLGSVKPLSFPAMIVGYLSFLLSLVRTAWLGWGIGVLNLLTSLKQKFQIRLILLIVVALLSIVPLILLEPFADVINTRLQTLLEGSGDGSAVDRQGTYNALLSYALTNFLGDGIGGQYTNFAFDSAVLDILISLGILGTVFYAGGMLLLLVDLVDNSKFSNDLFASTARAITMSMTFQLLFGSVMRGLLGMLLWGFLGIGLAAQKYHSNQHLIRIQSNLSTELLE